MEIRILQKDREIETLNYDVDRAQEALHNISKDQRRTIESQEFQIVQLQGDIGDLQDVIKTPSMN